MIGMIKKLFSNKKQMRLGVSYNLFDGEELIEQSIKSIRAEVDHINVVYQKVSNHGNNHAFSDELELLLKSLKEKGLVDYYELYTPDLKISQHYNEVGKRNRGLEIARENGCTHFVSFDTDEFYEIDSFKKAKEFILKNNITSTACHIVSYIKEPIYQISGTREAFVPFISKIYPKSKITLASKFPVLVDPTRALSGVKITKKRFKLFSKTDIVMHHMGLVRRDLDTKFRNSSANQKDNSRFFQLWENTKNWQYPNTFQYHDGGGGLKVKKVGNQFNIKL